MWRETYYNSVVNDFITSILLQEKFNETETYFEDGYRRVRPYYFTFVAHAKGK